MRFLWVLPKLILSAYLLKSSRAVHPSMGMPAVSIGSGSLVDRGLRSHLELQVKSLGMDVAIYDEEGKDIQHTGEAGELVCTHAHPSLPLGFWGDDKRVKFFDAYYGKYPGVWAQGDLAVINPLTKGIYILGRR
jgi:acyl-coenzyme A synthetase/AMP-(fatty) acid ligase